MSHIIERELFSFSEYSKELLNSTKSIKCSSDNQILICCRETLYLLTLSCDLERKSDTFLKMVPYKVLNKKIIELSDIPSFCISEGILDIASSLNKISPIERQDLIMDTSLHPHTFFPKPDLGGFRHAIFSLPCKFSQEMFIAVVTFDYRVFILRECFGNWQLFCEFTPVLKRHMVMSYQIPLVVGIDGIPFDQYKSFMQSMCCVEVMWSSPFLTSHSANLQHNTFLLFCGMRNGNVQVWEFKNGDDSMSRENSFNFISIDEYVSEVTSLCWHDDNDASSHQGYLAIGYMDGSVRILSVSQSLTASTHFEVKEHFSHEAKDNLAIFDLASTHLNTNKSILVACKQFFLEIYSIDGDKISFDKVMHIECSLPLESISLKGKIGSASSQDGSIHYFMFEEQDGDICIHHTKSKITCLPNASEIVWSCKGIAVSQNGALCYSVHRPFSDTTFKAVARARFQDRQRLVLSFTPHFTHDQFVLSPKHTSPTVYVSSVDVTVRLLLLMQHLFKHNQSLEAIDALLDKMNLSKRIENWQIARNVYFYEYFKIQKDNLKGKTLNFSSMNKPEELALDILCKHISNCFQYIDENDAEQFSSLSDLGKWVMDNDERVAALSQYMDVNRAYSLVKVELNRHLCVVCDEELVTFSDPLKINCANGHTNLVCCLTLSPIRWSNFRHCSSCYTAAMSVGEIESKRVPFVKTKDLCTLCGCGLE